MSSLILFNADNSHTHAFDVGFDMFGRDRCIDTPDVAIDRERCAAPRHHAAARFLADDYVLITNMIR